MKRIISVILCFVLLSLCAVVPSYAEYTAQREITLVKSDGQTVLLYDSLGFEEAATVKGVKYDEETNTLSLTDVDLAEYNLYCYHSLMDLKIEVNGECHIGPVYVYGSLEITGEGTIYINELKENKPALWVICGYTGSVVKIDDSVSVYAYAGNKSGSRINNAIEIEESLTEDSMILPGISSDDFTTFSYKMQSEVTVYLPETIELMEITATDKTAYPSGYLGDAYSVTETGKYYINVYEYDSDTGYAFEIAKDVLKGNGFDYDGIIEFEGDSTSFDTLKEYTVVTLDTVSMPVYLNKNDGQKYAIRRMMGNCYIYALKNTEKREYPIAVKTAEIEGDTIPANYEKIDSDTNYYVNYLNSDTYIYNAKGSAVKGDVNGNGNVDVSDARLCLRRAIKLENYEEGTKEYIACDVDGEAGVTVADARLILRAAVHLETL